MVLNEKRNENKNRKKKEKGQKATHRKARKIETN